MTSEPVNKRAKTDEPPTLSSKLTVCGSWFCPYVHRSWITLQEKNIDYDWVEIDLSNKPSWFLDFNPKGKVPVIAYQDGSEKFLIDESLTLIEFLEDYKSSPAMLPSHPAHRALARNTINAYNDKFVGLWYTLLRSPDKDSCLETAQKLNAELEQLQEKLSPDGPYFQGEQFSLVDAAVLPWLLRLPLLKHYRGYELPDSLDRLKKYIAASKERPSVQATLKTPDGEDYDAAMIRVYEKYGGEPVNYFADA